MIKNEQGTDVKFNKMHGQRNFQQQMCHLTHVMAIFVIGLSLSLFVPVIGLGTTISSKLNDRQLLSSRSLSNSIIKSNTSASGFGNDVNMAIDNTNELDFSSIYNIRSKNDKHSDSYAVTFVNEGKRSNKLESNTNERGSITFNRFNDSNEHLAREQAQIILDRRADGINVNALNSPYRIFASFKRHNKGNSKKYTTNTNTTNSNINAHKVLHNRMQEPNTSNKTNDNPFNVIDNNIFWGKIIEDALPTGFGVHHLNDWNNYVNENTIVKLEIGCGRMQNRLVTFQDGRKACARYRQNTDQIQGELFSFYLGRLLNLTNLAPSVASIIDLNANPWILAAQSIQTAQWKVQRPVVLTDWIPNLETANIPVLFQPIERHLNKFDVKNITLGLDIKPAKSLLHHLGGIKQNPNWNQLPIVNHPNDTQLNKTTHQKLIELAQWSDLIVFDYLIANLDRVVNNLYNFQWNADIMTAPAHNLARQSDSQLLIFLDNESGLLHGYRLLKKYETYHGLLLDSLCVFRRPTIESLQRLQNEGIGGRLKQIFEQSTSEKVRDILPSLPDKSIKILIDRIDRVLGQVQNCRELFPNR